MEKLAEARGLNMGEWFRELVLAELIASSRRANHPGRSSLPVYISRNGKVVRLSLREARNSSKSKQNK